MELKRAAVKDANTIWKMQTEAFAELLVRYQDYEISPGAEPFEKVGYRKTGKTEKVNDKMTLVYYEKN